MINRGRIKIISEYNLKGNIVYWMSREQRVKDNWGLLHARMLAKQFETELAVVFCLSPQFLSAGIRQYDFMLHGLNEVSHDLQVKNIPFYLLFGDPPEELIKFVKNYNVSHIVYDLDPLKIKISWQRKIAEYNQVNLIEVDSHNIVPVRLVSNKIEFGAFTLRPKIKKLLGEFIEEFPELEIQQKTTIFQLARINWTEINKRLKLEKEAGIIQWLHPGESSANEILQYFLSTKIHDYASMRNDPNKDVLSNLSPYLHFGQISAQRVALETHKLGFQDENTEAFLDELIIRRELSDNYCIYNTDYDNLNQIPQWAAETLDKHKNDKRDYIYSLKDFEKARTHESLWNAAQKELMISGKLHSYMRMYWAKKILEWSNSPEEAFKIAIFLNDKYQLDGRDPNGYTGCAWAIAGVHDRPWKERAVYGKIRYMNLNGAKRKFDVNKYIKTWDNK